jgi:hypothetical protein
LPYVLGGTDTQWGQFGSSVIVDGPNEFCGGSLVDNNHVKKSLFINKGQNYIEFFTGVDSRSMFVERKL